MSNTHTNEPDSKKPMSALLKAILGEKRAKSLEEVLSKIEATLEPLMKKVFKQNEEEDESSN